MPTAMVSRAACPALRGTYLILLFSALSACAGDPSSLPPGSVLFQDDFSRQSSGWPMRRTDQSIFEYADGRYSIQVLSPNTSLWSTPGVDVGPARIDVDALGIRGPENNLFGLICRYRNDDNFIFLVASSDGFAGIGEYRNGERSMLSAGTMLPAESIAPPGYSNHLAAECLPDRLRLYVNGSLAAEAAAGETSGGNVGLMAGTYSEPGVQIVFDNFTVRVPEAVP